MWVRLTSRWGGLGLSVLRLLVMALFCSPLLLMLLASLHAPGSVPVPGSLWPDKPGLLAWQAVFVQVPMAQALINSVLIVLLAVPLSVVTASLGGLGISRLGRRGQWLALLLMIVAASVPYSAIWLPRFIAAHALGLGGSWIPLWFPALMGGSPLLVLLYWFAIRMLPQNTLDAARLERLNWLSIWWQVVLPQLPGINLAAALLSGLWVWGNLLDPLLYLQRENDQTAVQMLSALELMGADNWPVLMAAAMLVCLPALLLLLLFMLRSAWQSLAARTVISAGALLLAVGGLAACSPSHTDTTTLRLQAVADPVEAKAYRALIAAFESTHPAVNVEFLPVGRHAEHVTRLVTAYAGGGGPDLFLINFRRWGQFLKHDLLQPLGPLLKQREGFSAEDYFAPSLEGFSRNGQLLCMPQNISSLAVYWNRALFEKFKVEPPQANWTWKQFHDAAVALTRDTNGDGKADVHGLAVDPSIIRLAPFVWQAGGQLVDNLERPTRFRLRDRDAVIGLMFLKRLKTERGVMPSLAQRRAIGPDARFMRGGAAMTLNSRRLTASLRAVKQLDWDVAPLPRYKQAATVLHADAYCLGRTSQHKTAAVDFVRFATSQAGQELLSQSGRIVPVNKAAAYSSAFLDKDQPPAHAQVFLDAINDLRRTPNIPNWYEIETRINPLIEEWMFETPAGGLAEEMTGLRDGYNLAWTIERSAASLLAGPEHD